MEAAAKCCGGNGAAASPSSDTWATSARFKAGRGWRVAAAVPPLSHARLSGQSARWPNHSECPFRACGCPERRTSIVNRGSARR